MPKGRMAKWIRRPTTAVRLRNKRAAHRDCSLERASPAAPELASRRRRNRPRPIECPLPFSDVPPDPRSRTSMTSWHTSPTPSPLCAAARDPSATSRSPRTRNLSSAKDSRHEIPSIRRSISHPSGGSRTVRHAFDDEKDAPPARRIPRTQTLHRLEAAGDVA